MSGQTRKRASSNPQSPKSVSGETNDANQSFGSTRRKHVSFPSKKTQEAAVFGSSRRKHEPMPGERNDPAAGFDSTRRKHAVSENARVDGEEYARAEGEQFNLDEETPPTHNCTNCSGAVSHDGAQLRCVSCCKRVHVGCVDAKIEKKWQCQKCYKRYDDAKDDEIVKPKTSTIRDSKTKKRGSFFKGFNIPSILKKSITSALPNKLSPPDAPEDRYPLESFSPSSDVYQNDSTTETDEESKHPGTKPPKSPEMKSKLAMSRQPSLSVQTLPQMCRGEFKNRRCYNQLHNVTGKNNARFSCEKAEIIKCGTPVLIRKVSRKVIDDNGAPIIPNNKNVCKPLAVLGVLRVKSVPVFGPETDRIDVDEPVRIDGTPLDITDLGEIDSDGTNSGGIDSYGTNSAADSDGADSDTINIVRKDVCDMQDWLNEVNDKEIDTTELLNICLEMTRGLRFLHEHGIKHRDISLRNFLIPHGVDSPRQHSDPVEVCDYGLQRCPRQRQRSAIEVVCFDVYYFRSDVYSFGIALWELFSRGKKMNIFDDNPEDEEIREKLLRHNSIADLLEMKHIPPEIAWLIRKCTMNYRGCRPSMESIEQYIKELLEKGTLRKPANGDYSDSSTPTESEKICEMFNSHFINELLLAQPKQPKQKKLKKGPCRKISRNNIRICKENGICTKEEFKEYLMEHTHEDLFYDGFVQVQQWDIILEYLFDGEGFVEVQKKIRDATNLRTECTKKVEITLDRKFPTRTEEQYLFLHNTRQTCRTENLLTLVKDSMETGSIKITLLATPENMEKLRDMLNDPNSSLRAPGSIFASVDASSIEISDADVFGSSSDNEEYKDSFGFGSLGFTEPQVRNYVKGFFDYGVYTTDELIEFFNMFDDDDGIMRADMEEDFAEIVPPEDHRQKIRGLVMPKDPQEAAVAAGGPHSDDGGSTSKPNDDPFSIREEKTPSIESASHTYVDNAPIYPKVSSNALDASDGWEKVCSCWKYQGRRHKPKPEPTQGTCHTAPVDFLGLYIPGRDLETDFHMDQAPLCDTYYGENWLALEKATKRRVLLKRSDLGYAGEKITLRNHRPCSCDISQEIKILQYISSLPEPKPHFVGFIDAFHDFKDGKNWITVAMEYVDGYDLHKYINNKMPKYTNSDKEREATAKEREAKTRVIMGQMLHAVSYLHSMGVVHRDLSLQNILISMDKDGHEIVKIIDFTWSCGGPGTKYYNADKWQAKTDPPVGNPRFMSPEAFNLLSHDLLANDIWSCGIVFLVLLIGEFPYDTPYNNPAYQLIKSGDVRQLLHERTGGKFSDDCADLLQAMLRPEKNRIKMEDILTHSFWTPADHGRPVDITYTSKIPDKTGALKQAHEMGSRDKAAGIKGIYDFGEKDRSPRDVYAN